MMKNLNALCLLFFLTLLFTSCEKEKDKEPTKEQLLMAKNWKATAIMASVTLKTPLGETKINTDFFDRLTSCQKDNLLKFESGGKVTMDEGASKCSTSDPQTVQGTWSLNENALTIEGNVLKAFSLNTTAPVTLTIQELTSETLRTTTPPQSINYQGIPASATFDITFAGQ